MLLHPLLILALFAVTALSLRLPPTGSPALRTLTTSRVAHVCASAEATRAVADIAAADDEVQAEPEEAAGPSDEELIKSQALGLEMLQATGAKAAIQYPFRRIRYLKELIESQRAYADQFEFWWRRYELFGPVFEAMGMLCLCDPSIVQAALVGPQKRPSRLGNVKMKRFIPAEGPAFKGEPAFALALANGGSPGQHKAVRDGFREYVFTSDCAARADAASDPVARKLLMQAVAQLEEHGIDAFCATDTEGMGIGEKAGASNGMLRFWTSTVMFYAMTGMDVTTEDGELDPACAEPFSGVTLLSSITSSWMDLLTIGPLPILQDQKKFEKAFEAAAELFASTPALEGYDEGRAGGLNKLDFARNVVSILVLKGKGLGFDMVFETMMLGSEQARRLAPDFTRPATVPAETWREAGADREKIRLIILETLRLVPSTAGMPTETAEPLTVTIDGKEMTFPPGTTVFNVILQAQLDEALFGEEPESFCPFKRATALWGASAKLMAFSSVGDEELKEDPRTCPGRELALNILTDFFVELAHRDYWK